MAEVPSPMFISSRLMAAIKIGDHSVCHIEAAGPAGYEDRITYKWLIEHEGVVLGEAADITCVGDVDYRQAMSTLLTFLEAAAEAVAYGPDSDNIDLFPETVMEWAAENDTDIQVAHLDLEEATR